jgi:hypothetical protein
MFHGLPPMLLYTPVSPLIREIIMFFIFGAICLIQFLLLLSVEALFFPTKFPMKINGEPLKIHFCNDDDAPLDSQFIFRYY